MEDEQKALKLQTTPTVDGVSQMRIELNQVLEIKAAQARRERDETKSQNPHRLMESTKSFRKLIPHALLFNFLQLLLPQLKEPLVKKRKVQLPIKHLLPTFSAWKQLTKPEEELLVPQRPLEMKTSIFRMIKSLYRTPRNWVSLIAEISSPMKHKI